MNDIKPLEIDFTLRGVKYHQMKRDGDLAIYRRESPNWLDYEVIRIRVSKAGIRTLPDGRTLEFGASEKYPLDESWGTHGWTYQSEEWAYEKFEELLSQRKDADGSDLAGVLVAGEGQDTGSNEKGLES